MYKVFICSFLNICLNISMYQNSVKQWQCSSLLFVCFVLLSPLAIKKGEKTELLLKYAFNTVRHFKNIMVVSVMFQTRKVYIIKTPKQKRMKDMSINSSHKFEIFTIHILHFLRLWDETCLQLSQSESITLAPLKWRKFGRVCPPLYPCIVAQLETWQLDFF